MPRKMRQLAIKSALSAKAAQVRVLVGAEGIEGRTRAMVSLLSGIGAAKNTLVIVPERNERVEGLYRATGNIENVKVLHASYLNMADLLKYERILFTVEALEKISGIWGSAGYTATVSHDGSAGSVSGTTTMSSAAIPPGATIAPEVMTTTMAQSPPGTPMAESPAAAEMAMAMDEDAELELPASDTVRLRRDDETEGQA
jgi:hypothetical protein